MVEFKDCNEVRKVEYKGAGVDGQYAPD